MFRYFFIYRLHRSYQQIDKAVERVGVPPVRNLMGLKFNELFTGQDQENTLIKKIGINDRYETQGKGNAYRIDPSKLDLLDQCKEHIGMALAEIRNLSHRLAPAFFDESTLEEAFERLFADFNMEKHTDISLHYEKSINELFISRDVQLNLYRILQEQLRNIQKYAKATLIAVDVLIHNNKLRMQVTDDGIGFDPKLVKQGIGLANMKRRAALFGGNFNLESSPGNGCTIIVDMPL